MANTSDANDINSFELFWSSFCVTWIWQILQHGAVQELLCCLDINGGYHLHSLKHNWGGGYDKYMDGIQRTRLSAACCPIAHPCILINLALEYLTVFASNAVPWCCSGDIQLMSKPTTFRALQLIFNITYQYSRVKQDCRYKWAVIGTIFLEGCVQHFDMWIGSFCWFPLLIFCPEPPISPLSLLEYEAHFRKWGMVQSNFTSYQYKGAINQSISHLFVILIRIHLEEEVTGGNAINVATC